MPWNGPNYEMDAKSAKEQLRVLRMNQRDLISDIVSSEAFLVAKRAGEAHADRRCEELWALMTTPMTDKEKAVAGRMARARFDRVMTRQVLEGGPGRPSNVRRAANAIADKVPAAQEWPIAVPMPDLDQFTESVAAASAAHTTGTGTGA